MSQSLTVGLDKNKRRVVATAVAVARVAMVTKVTLGEGANGEADTSRHWGKIFYMDCF